MDKYRPEAEEILKQVESELSKKGRLRIFFGYSAGVGKTYAMLKEAHEQQEEGKNIVIGYIEPHNRPETNKLIEGLKQVELLEINYKNIKLYELNVDKVIEENPDIVVVDELAHTNAIGSRNKKRYQDVEEILNAGIDVYTTMNVQHLDSLNDVVEDITGVVVKETVPDTVLENASWKVIDIESAELIERLKSGKVYSDENSKRALENFFTTDKLNLLRALSIQRTSEHISRNIKDSKSSVKVNTKILTIAQEDYPKMSEKAIRWSSRLAFALDVDWTVLVLKSNRNKDEDAIKKNIEISEKLGAEVIILESENFLETIIEYVKLLNITDIVMGKNLNQSVFKKLFSDDDEDVLLKKLPFVEVHLIPFKETKVKSYSSNLSGIAQIKKRDAIISIFAMFLIVLISGVLNKANFGKENLILIQTLFVAITATLTTGYLWSIITAVVSVVVFNWFFVEPIYSFAINQKGFLVTLILMLGVSLLISNLVNTMKIKASHSEEREKQFEILYELNKEYVLANKIEDVYNSVTTFLSKLLNREVIIYSADGDVESSSEENKNKSKLNNEQERAIAIWSAINQKKSGFGTDTLVGANGFYMPINLDKKTIVVLGLERSKEKPLTSGQLNYLEIVIAQLKVAIQQVNFRENKDL